MGTVAVLAILFVVVAVATIVVLAINYVFRRSSTGDGDDHRSTSQRQ
jgi:hypothetical protein